MAQRLVEPIESRLSILEPLCIVPAQSREELKNETRRFYFRRY